MPIHPKSAAWKVQALSKDYRALAEAYADSWPEKSAGKIFKALELGYKLRSLQFRSGVWVSPDNWALDMLSCCPEYNDFRSTTVGSWLKKFKGISVQGAREYSVCLYVKGPADVLAKMEAEADSVKAQEHNIQQDGTLRLWWD